MKTETAFAIEKAELKLNVLLEQRSILERLDGLDDCWCKYHKWTSERKASFIQDVCKSLGSEGFDKELSLLLGYHLSNHKGSYPECLKWKDLYKACLIVKVVPDALERIRNSKKVNLIKKEFEEKFGQEG